MTTQATILYTLGMMSEERWLPVVGFEESHEVSDAGRVRSVDRISMSGKRLKSHLVKQNTNKRTGYRMVNLQSGGRKAVRAAHRLVAEAFLGEPPVRSEVCHWDGDKANNRLSNLRYDTRSANSLDSVRQGLHPQARKGRCVRGHLLEEPNLVESDLKSGVRKCKACHRGHVYFSRYKIHKTEEEMTRVANEVYERFSPEKNV